MSRKHPIALFGMTIGCIMTIVIFQNCSASNETPNSHVTAQGNVTVLCSPASDCLRYRLTTYPFDNNDCLGGANKVQLDNFPSANGGSVTNIAWNNCQSQSATEACCPQGLITGSFRTFSGDRTLSVSFDNRPGNIYRQENQ